jgi:hypothetical protein
MAWDSTKAWAWQEFGKAKLGDFRNVRRAVRMAIQAVERPSGRLSAVFTEDRELQAAYDFLENPRVLSRDLGRAIAAGCACRCAALPFAWIAVDGTSLSLRDDSGQRGLGPIGHAGTSGLKVISSCAVDPDGTPMGLGHLNFWVRKPAPRRKDGGKKDCSSRKLQDKETQRWLDAIRDTREVWQQHAPRVRRWWVMDREADSWAPLLETCRSDEWMTIRNKANRRVKTSDSSTLFLREVLAAQPVIDEFELYVPASPKRRARTARMQVRCCPVTLDLRDKFSSKRYPLAINVLWAREVGTTPQEEDPLDWVLLTNHPIDTLEDTALVLFSYTCRWRIEEFHRAWKRGGCFTEQTLLRRPEQIIKWAMILATVSARAERLKVLSRNEPKLPASVELTTHEIAAIRALRRRAANKRERIPKMPTIEQAVLWIALLGGYTGKSSGGPPGTATIMRGLIRLRDVALGFELAAALGAPSDGSASGNSE